MHLLYSNDLLHQIQCGFSPQKSTTDASMTVKDFIDEAPHKRANFSVGQPRRQMRLRCNVVAKYFKGFERFSLSQKRI